MAGLTELMSAYYNYHTKAVTRLTHFIGVPFIIFAIQVLFYPLQIFNVSLTWLAVCALVIYYLFLDVPLALATGAALVIITSCASLVPQGQTAWGVFAAAFIGGWVLQLVGHIHEGKRPALTDNLLQIFVAPIFLVAEFIFILGYRKHLEREVISLAAVRHE